MNIKRSFNDEEMKAFEPAEKIGIVASINPEGQPHLSLITSIMAPKPDQITLGQFCEGFSKQYIQQNHHVAFLIMTMDKKLWRGKAQWSHLKKEGPEYERYNQIPMFRYNTYFGINTVHYLDLIETSECQNLPMPQIILAAMLTKFAKSSVTADKTDRILPPFAEQLFNQLGSLKFLSYVGADNYPEIIPLIQCQAAGSRTLAFSSRAFRSELTRLEPGTEVAVFGLTMGMEDVLVRGVFQGFRSYRFIKLGTVGIQWVYNSMPPAHGQIYPEVKLAPITDF